MRLTAQDSCSLLETEELRIVSNCYFSSSGRCIPLETPICISLRYKAS